MHPSGCLILLSRTCVALHMRHHPQQWLWCYWLKWRYGSFSNVLVWGKWEYFGQWSTIVQHFRVCLTDGIAYCTMKHLYSCHDSILFQMDMLIHCSTTWTIHSISDSSSICDEVIWCFFQSSMCVSTLSQHSKMNFNYFQTISCWVNIQHSILKYFNLTSLL